MLSVKKLASIIPVKIAISLTPRLEIAAHTCTLIGCLGWPFSRGGSHQRWNVIFAWLSKAIELSSVKITSLNSSFVASSSWQCSNRFILFASLTIWQYLVPVDSHPSLYRARLIVVAEILIFIWSEIIRTRSSAVVSSFFSIAWSIKSNISSVVFGEGRGLLVWLASSPVSSYRRINLVRLCLSIVKLFSSKRVFKISLFLNPFRCNEITLSFKSSVRRGMFDAWRCLSQS